MVVGVKDATKLVTIFIMIACAIFVSTLFLNYNIDIMQIEDNITTEQMKIFYDAQVNTAIVVSCVSGGCLLLTSVVMLIFYIKNYVDMHKKELGILKALGYSNIKIALNFWVFGLSTLLGASVGYLGANIMMPTFYSVQNKDNFIPEVICHFHPLLLVCLVILPTLFFSLVAILYANYSLKTTALNLLKDNLYQTKKEKKYKERNNDNSFLKELKRSTLREKKMLAFFIIFASFCFSSMTQMAFSMNELASPLMGWMVLIIGILLACTTLLLAIVTVINGNKKSIAMMKVFGYSQKDCSKSIIEVYRPLSYIGFIIGTGYQYALLRVMVDIVFKDFEGLPEYNFDVPVMFVSLACFIVFYELVMYVYSQKIKKISIKEIMLES